MSWRSRFPRGRSEVARDSASQAAVFVVPWTQVLLDCGGALAVHPSKRSQLTPLSSLGAEHLIGPAVREDGKPGSGGTGPSSKLRQDTGSWEACPEEECSG